MTLAVRETLERGMAVMRSWRFAVVDAEQFQIVVAETETFAEAEIRGSHAD